uniref:Uncharacterized protein n=1 Tax=Physcomitrium patens TaxID=3218 RepID=A0A2K1K6X7_PHYPA|nr:hypothetical protein PHYPA_011421 [Physcomitrium patens]
MRALLSSSWSDSDASVAEYDATQHLPRSLIFPFPYSLWCGLIPSFLSLSLVYMLLLRCGAVGTIDSPAASLRSLSINPLSLPPSLPLSRSLSLSLSLSVFTSAVLGCVVPPSQGLPLHSAWPLPFPFFSSIRSFRFSPHHALYHRTHRRPRRPHFRFHFRRRPRHSVLWATRVANQAPNTQGI